MRLYPHLSMTVIKIRTAVAHHFQADIMSLIQEMSMTSITQMMILMTVNMTMNIHLMIIQMTILDPPVNYLKKAVKLTHKAVLLKNWIPGFPGTGSFIQQP